MHETIRSPGDIGADAYSQTETRYAVLMKGRIQTSDRDFQIRICNISAGGLMAKVPGDIMVGTPVLVTIRTDDAMTGIVVWCDGGRAGVAFDTPIDPLALLGRESAPPAVEIPPAHAISDPSATGAIHA